MAPLDPDQQRAAARDAWERAADAWGRHAQRIRDSGMPVSLAMVEALDLRGGERVLELAAGAGDTGFIAAALIRPADSPDGGDSGAAETRPGQVPRGTLISSDGAKAMVEVARRRAEELGIVNVEFKQLELEWIDLETATVDAVLCRWGLMLAVDAEAAAHEIRRVLRPGGRAAVAVWDVADANPWATVPTRALVELGHAEPPDPEAPGPFALAPAARLSDLLEGAGFTDVEIATVDLERSYSDIEDFIAETAEVSPTLSAVFPQLDDRERTELTERIAAGAAPFTASDGSIVLPGRSLVANAIA